VAVVLKMENQKASLVHIALVMAFLCFALAALYGTPGRTAEFLAGFMLSAAIFAVPTYLCFRVRDSV